jgi:hypothetical protein
LNKFLDNSNLPSDSLILNENGYSILVVFKINDNTYIGKVMHPNLKKYNQIAVLRKKEDTFIFEGPAMGLNIYSGETISTSEYVNGWLNNQLKIYNNNILQEITTYKNGTCYRCL